MVFTVTLGTAQGGLVTVRATTASGSATAPDDYKHINKVVKFKPGKTSGFLVVPVQPDAAVEGAETLSVTLSEAVGGTIVDGTGIGTIVDDDVTAGNRASLGDVTVYEGDSAANGRVTAKIAITLSEPAASLVTLEIVSGSISATEGVDYRKPIGYYGGPKFVKFKAGQYKKVLALSIYTDATVEADESFYIDIVAVTGPATATGGAGYVTILNDD